MDGDLRLQGSSANALRSASLWLVATSIVAACFMALVTRVPVSLDGIDILSWMVAIFLTLSMLLNSRIPRVADSFGAIGQAWLGGLAACAVAVAGLRFQMPTRDAALLAMDRAIGVDGISVLAWTQRQPDLLVHLLSSSYSATVVFAFVSFLLLALVGDRLELWRAVMCFVGSVLTTCLIAVATPALGMSAWAAPGYLARISSGSARHYWPRFEHFQDFHDGGRGVLELGSLGSCVTFPSFHAIMGLIVVAMWRKHPLVLAPACVWCALMLFSTLPFGGHYVVDLIGGAAVWGLWFVLSQRVERSGWTPFAALGAFRLVAKSAPSVGN